MKVALIGATGMLGNHTARALIDREHQLVVIHREGSDLSRIAGVPHEPRIGNLDDPRDLVSAFRDCDGVVHAAAYYPREPLSWKTHRDRARKQMAGFLDACRRADLQRIVYVGGSIVLKRSATGAPGNEELDYEDAPPQRNGYIQAKWVMDRQARDAAIGGLPVTIGIPGMTFGEYDYGPSTGQIMTEIANGNMPGFVDGPRNVIYAGDAGRGLALVLEQGVPGERYLLTGTNTDMAEVVGKIAEIANVPPPRKVPMTAARLLAWAQRVRFRLGGSRPKLTDTALAVMGEGQHLTGAKAEQELGFMAEASLEEALRRAYEWFVEVGYIGR